jgi:hypothetical protein
VNTTDAHPDPEDLEKTDAGTVQPVEAPQPGAPTPEELEADHVLYSPQEDTFDDDDAAPLPDVDDSGPVELEGGQDEGQ